MSENTVVSTITSASTSELYHPFTPEKVRGMFASVAAGLTGNAMNVFGQSIIGLNPLVSTVIFLQVGGNLIGYMLDILFAKEVIAGSRVPYTAFLSRLAFMLGSIASTMFFKFIITVIIDSIIVVEMLSAAMNILDKNGIKFRFRNELVAAAISVVTFILWTNALRFNWAYAEFNNPVMDIIMVAWLAIVIMIFCATRNVRSGLETSNKWDFLPFAGPVAQPLPFI